MMTEKNHRRFWLLVLALLATIVAAYSNHFDNDFHFDDSHIVQENLYIRDLANLPRFFTDPSTKGTLPTNLAYRPVLMVTLAVDYWLGGGLEPFYFHLSTFLWFLLQLALMYFLYLRILERSHRHPWNRYVALLIAGWFGVHTANTETINYVTARSDSLSTLCVVMAFVIWLYATGWRKQLHILPILAGVLIKPTVVMYVPLVLLYELLFERRLGLDELLDRRKLAPAAGVLWRLVPVAIIAALGFWFTSWMTPDSWSPGGTSRWRYLITQPFVMLRYFWLFFLPVGLSADTDWTTLAGMGDIRFAIGCLFLAATIGVAVVTSRRRELRPIGFGLLWFLIALVPSSSVIPLSEVTNDHRLFYPYVGLTLSVGWALALALMRVENCLRRSRAAVVGVVCAIALVFAAHAYGTHSRNRVWATEESLWHDVTLKSPLNGRGLMNYGLTQMAKGDYATALRYFEAGLTTGYGTHPLLQINIAIAKNGLGRSRDEVETHFREALRLGPHLPPSYYYYARWLNGVGRTGEAVDLLEQTLELSPGHHPAAQLLATIRGGEQARLLDAEALVQRSPTATNLIDLSLLYYRAGHFEDTIRACERALEIDPELATAYNNLCSAYNSLGRWDEGIAACERALSIAPDNQLARNNLKWARNGKARAAQSE